MNSFDYFMENPYWKSIYGNAPSNECKEYYRIMFEYFSFDTDEEAKAGIEGAEERLMVLMLTRKDAEYIRDHAGSNIAKHKYNATIQWLFDDEKAEAVSASMFKGEIRNPNYTPIDVKVEEPRISSGTACFLIKDDSIKTWKQFFDDEPNAVVNCETELYQCPACHELTSEYDLSLYRRVKDDGSPIVYWSHAGNEDFQFVKSFVHKCPRCSTRMRKIQGIPESIICPDCGAEIAIEPVSFLWD